MGNGWCAQLQKFGGHAIVTLGFLRIYCLYDFLNFPCLYMTKIKTRKGPIHICIYFQNAWVFCMLTYYSLESRLCKLVLGELIPDTNTIGNVYEVFVKKFTYMFIIIHDIFIIFYNDFILKAGWFIATMGLYLTPELLVFIATGTPFLEICHFRLFV